ncbi:MAG: SDR family oxidoreductase [Alphaproteobacteria bacterium]|nr:SDR family oxidoreductase [Alphaproteobacteria bacterium]
MGSEVFREGLLEGQVAVVTGGGTGLGAAAARELAHLGATVIIASRKAEHIEPAAAGLSAQVGRTVHGDVLDIRDREAVDAFVARTLDRHGRIDLLVNNGGGQFFSPAEAIKAKGWDAVIGTNLTGTWNLIQATANAWMLEHGGRIVNITMLTKRTFCGMAHSVSARAGVEALTRTLAVEWARAGILVNCVAPGVIASNGLNNYPAGLQLAEQMRDKIPLKRLGHVDDIAWMIAYLASPAGRYVTGQTFTVDGGKELWGDWWGIPDPEPPHPIEIPVEPWETE